MPNFGLRSMYWSALGSLALSMIACGGGSFWGSSENTRTTGKPASSRDSSDDACLFVRSGTDLTTDQRKAYGNVGMLAQLNAQGQVVSICTGMLVRPDVVLTAQHCVANSNQVPFPVTSLGFSLDPTNATVSRSVKSIIQWAERTTPPSIYRDVALVTLDKPYDESFPIYDLRQTKADVSAGISDLTMVGFGGYTNGNDANSYSVGNRRYGLAQFNGFTDAPFPEYTNPNFLGTGDYLSIAQGNSGQIICAGDSGSSLFWDSGAARMIVGITSLGASANGTPGQQCASTSQGLFVPSHQVRNWVSARLGEIKSGDKLDAYSLLQGAVKSVTDSATFSTVVISAVKNIDDGLSISLPEVSFSLCKKDCSPLTEITGDFAVGGSVSVRLIKVGDKIQATSIRPATVPPVYPVEFSATVADLPTADTETYGRAERAIKFSNVKLPEGTSALPLVGGQAIGRLCSTGCSVSPSVKTVGFNIAKDKGVTIKAEVIEGHGVYIREIAANPLFNAEEFLPKPATNAAEKAAADDDDDDDDAPPAPKKKSTKKKNKC